MKNPHYWFICRSWMAGYVTGYIHTQVDKKLANCYG